MKKVGLCLLLGLLIFFTGCQYSQTTENQQTFQEQSSDPLVVDLPSEQQQQESKIPSFIDAQPVEVERAQAVYGDGSGKDWDVTSNNIELGVAEDCETPDLPLVEELAPPPPGKLSQLLEIPTHVALGSNHNNLIVSAVATRPEFKRPEPPAPLGPPKIVLEKTADKDLLCCDSDVTFTIRAINEGESDAYDVRVEEVIPSNLEYLEASAGAEPFYSDITFRKNSEGKVTRIVWNIPGPIPAGGEGAVFYSISCPLKRPQLSCYLRFEPRFVKANEEGEVICTVSNNGTGEAKGAILQVSLPYGVDHQDPTQGKSLEFELGAIAPKESTTVNIPIIRREGGLLDQITSRVIAVNAPDCECTVPPIPTLTIDKTGPTMRKDATAFEYDIVVRNVSERDAPATGCVLVDTLPPGSTFEEANEGGYYDPNNHTVTWQLGTLMPGDMVSRKVKLRPTKIGTLVNKARVTSSEGVQLEAQAQTEVVGFTAMHISKYDTEDPVIVGDKTTYVIEVRNEGFQKATGVVLTNIIPDLSEFIRGKGTGPNGEEIRAQANQQEIVFDSVAVLEPGEKVVYQITVRITGASDKLLNRTKLKYNEFARELIVEEPTSSYE